MLAPAAAARWALAAAAALSVCRASAPELAVAACGAAVLGMQAAAVSATLVLGWALERRSRRAWLARRL